MQFTRLARVAAFILLAATGAAHAVTHAELQPILQSRCVICHNGPSAPLGLQLDSLAGLLKGSSRGPVVKAGDPAGSELMRRIRGQSQPRMPMTGPPWLTDAEVALFERWIAEGVPAEAVKKPAGKVPVAAAKPKPASAASAVAVVAASSAVPQTVSAQPAADAAVIPAPDRFANRPVAGQAPTWAHVAPIFATRCAKCHSAQGLMGPAPEGVLLNSYDGALAAGDRARIVPGNPAASELLRRIQGTARPRMPFDGPPWLADDEIALIRDWIAAGAPDSSGVAAPVPAGARVRLRGVLSGDGTLDGLVLPGAFGGGNEGGGGGGGGRRGGRRDRKPQAGDGIELRATVQPDGSLVADRIRSR
ncbi:MAG: c-type cytochrome domain-containing protein [Leptothrix sp. (in: b-proteobacteria)]